MSQYSLQSGVLICEHVFKQTREIALIVHHSDGMWSFMCGQSDHDEHIDCFEVAHVEHLFERDPEIEAVAQSLKSGFLADRTNGDWLLAAHDD